MRVCEILAELSSFNLDKEFTFSSVTPPTQRTPNINVTS